MIGYYLQDNPNLAFGQFGWKRTKVSGVIGVHTAENNTDFAGPDPGAEDVARFLGRRTDPGSYHAIADADSRIKLIHPRYSAWADTTNNPHAMSVSGAMQAARWRELTPERAAALTRNMAYAAVELVQDAIAAGLLDEPTPARRITPAEAIAGSRAGFYGHGETNPGRRYDPGANFDWDLFLQTYASAIGGGLAAQGTITEEEDDDMANLTLENLAAIKQASYEGAQQALEWPVDTDDGKKLSVFGMVAAVLPFLKKLPDLFLDTETDRRGDAVGGKTSLRGMLAYYDQGRVEQLQASVAAARADGASAEEIMDAVKAGLAAGVKVEAVVKVGE